jgi:hypothetical protein
METPLAAQSVRKSSQCPVGGNVEMPASLSVDDERLLG